MDSLELKNFQGFDQIELEFAPAVNVLVGDNGSGKTAILDGLTIAAGTALYALDDVKTRHIRKRDIRKTWDSQSPGNPEGHFPVSVLARGEVFGDNVEWARTIDHANGRTTSRLASDLKELSQGVNRMIREEDPDYELPLIAYYSTGRLWLQKRERKDYRPEEPRYQGYYSAIEPVSAEHSLRDWMKQVGLEARQRTAAEESLLSVLNALVEATPEITNVLYNPEEDLLLAEQHERLLPLDALSDGYRNFLSLVADIAYRCAALNPHLGANAPRETSGLVLIDEIDLHLHPRWQRRVISDLQATFPSLQFIATTHSPFIIQALDRQPGVRLINLDDGEVGSVEDLTIEDIAEMIQGVEIPQRSHRFQQMEEAAMEYYALLEEAQDADEEELAAIKEELNKLAAPFSANPAYQAYLKMKRYQAGLAEGERGG